MDETHLINAIAHVSLNPVRARLAKRATDRPWSSVHAYLVGRDDGLYDPLRRAESIGHAIGSIDFIAGLESRLKRRLFPQKRGPKPRG